MKRFWSIPVFMLGLVVMVAVFAYSAFLTIDLSTRIFPGRVLEPLLSLALFDIGAVAWFAVFMWGSEGLVQRAISLLMFLFSFLGMTLTSLGDLFLGGQEIAAVSKWIDTGTLLVLMYWIWVTIHSLSGFVFIASHPKVWEKVWQAIHDDSVADKARTEAMRQIEITSTALTPQVGYRAHDHIMRGQRADYGQLMQEAYAGGGGADPRDAEIIRLRRELAERSVPKGTPARQANQARVGSNGHTQPMDKEAGE